MLFQRSEIMDCKGEIFSRFFPFNILLYTTLLFIIPIALNKFGLWVF